MESIQFPMVTTTAKMSTQRRWTQYGEQTLEKLGTSVNDYPVLFTTLLEKLGITDLCYYKQSALEYDQYFGKFVEWCLNGLLPFSFKSESYSSLKELCENRATISLLQSSGNKEKEAEEKLAATVIKFMYEESLAKSQGTSPWLDSWEASRTEFLKAFLCLTRYFAKDTYAIRDVMEAGSKAVALLAAGSHNKPNDNGALLLFDNPETEVNLTEPPEKWRRAFELFQAKVYNYYADALKELMTYGTLPVVSYPLELESLIQFAQTSGCSSAFLMD